MSNITNTTSSTSLNYMEKVSFTSMLILLSIFSLLGNGLVFFSFACYRPLRTLTHYFIVSLAVSDVLVALVNIPVWVVLINYGLKVKIFGQELLQLWIYFDILAGLASIFNLVAVTIDRYLHVLFPFKHADTITKNRVLYAIMFIWMTAAMVAFLRGFVPWRSVYETFVFLIGFVLPFMCITICYGKMFKEIKLLNQVSCAGGNAKMTSTDIKTIKTISIIIIAFFFCWCPFFILVFIKGFCGCIINHHFITYAKLLHYANSAINPVVYACYNKEFRKGFKHAFKKHFINCDSKVNVSSFFVSKKCTIINDSF